MLARRPVFMRTITVLAGFAVISSLSLGQSVTLRLNLKPGATYQFSATNKMTTDGAGTMSAMGNMGQTMAMAVKVMSQTARASVIQMKVTSMKFDVPPNSPIGQSMANSAKQMTGATIEQTYSPQGKAISSKVVSGGAGAQQLLGQFGAMRTGFFGVEFPAGPVAPGAKWSTTIDFSKVLGSAVPGMVKMGQNSKLPVHYNLIRVENRGAKRIAHIGIAMNGSMEMSIGGAPPPGGAAGKSQMPPMKMKLMIQTKGTMEVDVATGMPLKGSTSGTTTTGVAGMNIVQKMSSSFAMR